MAHKYRGYQRYNGRGSKAKTALAILLGLIILAAAVFLLLQSYIYYDASGRPHIRLPERPAQEELLSPDDVELIIENGDTVQGAPEEAPVFTRYTSAFSVTEDTLKKGTGEIRKVWTAGISDSAAAAITLKDGEGKVWFDSRAAIPGSVAATAEVSAAVSELANGDGVYTIARMNTLHDPLTAKQWVTDMGLRNRDGYIFYDGNNSQWLDANKPRTRQKICEMVTEAVDLGFDEILLTGFAYPTEGNLEQVNDGGVDRVETLESLLKEIRGVLPEAVKLSVELPAETVQNGGNAVAGHRMSSLVPLLDTIYSETTEADAVSLRESVAEISADCGFIAEVTDAGNMENQYLLLK